MLSALLALTVMASPPVCPRQAAGYDVSSMNCAAPGPVVPPTNGSIIAPFCSGDYKGKCVGGMGNWWSPSIATLGGGVVVVTAEGKSSTSTTHNTPTFLQVSSNPQNTQEHAYRTVVVLCCVVG
jgi:hypothetical protein